MVRHMHKDDGDKDCHWGLPSNIQFWQFYNLILSHLENFCRLWYTVLLCCKCSSPPGTTKIWHCVGINNFQSNMVWQNKICGYPLAYGYDVFPKLEISSKFLE